jgi:hypothetical protein
LLGFVVDSTALGIPEGFLYLVVTGFWLPSFRFLVTIRIPTGFSKDKDSYRILAAKFQDSGCHQDSHQIAPRLRIPAESSLLTGFPIDSTRFRIPTGFWLPSCFLLDINGFGIPPRFWTQPGFQWDSTDSRILTVDRISHRSH